MPLSREGTIPCSSVVRPPGHSVPVVGGEGIIMTSLKL